MFRKLAIAALALSMLGATAGGTAQAASLVGANVSCTLVDAFGRTCGPDFVVTAMGAMPDAQISFDVNPIVDINFMNRWVDISVRPGSTIVFDLGSSLTFSGLFSQSGAPLQGFGALSIENVGGLEPDDIVFDAALGTLTIDLSATFWNTSVGSVGLDLTAPLPAPVLLLLSGLLGLGAMRRLRKA